MTPSPPAVTLKEIIVTKETGLKGQLAMGHDTQLASTLAHYDASRSPNYLSCHTKTWSTGEHLVSPSVC